MLAGLLLALFVATMRSDAVVPGERETTFLAGALSLAWDGDLTWARADYDRYLELFGEEPGALALQSSSDGERIGFARPSAYMVLLAPFVRVSPRRGPGLLNWLLLLAAAASSAFVLMRRIGPWAPAWIAAFVAGTTAFTLLPLPSPGVFRLSAAALAWALVVHVMPAAAGARRRPLRSSSRESSSGVVGGACEREDLERPAGVSSGPRAGLPGDAAMRWSLVGSLLALATVASADGASFLPALAVAAWLALRQPRRDTALLCFAVAAALTAAASLGVSAQVRGGFAAVERVVFGPSTGFPTVDFEAGEWRSVHAASVAPSTRPVPDLRPILPLDVLTVVDAVAGRTIGIAPYCAPLVWAALWGLFASGWRRALLIGGLASLALRVVLFPFDLGDESALRGPGGAAALLPMFWFLAGRVGLWRIAAVTVSSALFLYPLWLRPGAAFASPSWATSAASSAANPAANAEGVLHRFLPVETGQRPRTGEPADLFVGDVWLRPLLGRISPFGESGLVVEGGSAEFLVGWEQRAGAADGGGPTGSEGAAIAIRGRGEGGRPVEGAALPVRARTSRATSASRQAEGEGRRPRLWLRLETQDTTVEVVGGVVAERRRLSTGQTLVQVLLDAPEASRRMWWSKGTVDLFRLAVTLDGGDDPTSHHRLRIGFVP